MAKIGGETSLGSPRPVPATIRTIEIGVPLSTLLGATRAEQFWQIGGEFEVVLVEGDEFAHSETVSANSVIIVSFRPYRYVGKASVRQASRIRSICSGVSQVAACF